MAYVSKVIKQYNPVIIAEEITDEPEQPATVEAGQKSFTMNETIIPEDDNAQPHVPEEPDLLATGVQAVLITYEDGSPLSMEEII